MQDTNMNNNSFIMDYIWLFSTSNSALTEKYAEHLLKWSNVTWIGLMLYSAKSSYDLLRDYWAQEDRHTIGKRNKDETTKTLYSTLDRITLFSGVLSGINFLVFANKSITPVIPNMPILDYINVGVFALNQALIYSSGWFSDVRKYNDRLEHSTRAANSESAPEFNSKYKFESSVVDFLYKTFHKLPIAHTALDMIGL